MTHPHDPYGSPAGAHEGETPTPPGAGAHAAAGSGDGQQQGGHAAYDAGPDQGYAQSNGYQQGVGNNPAPIVWGEQPAATTAPWAGPPARGTSAAAPVSDDWAAQGTVPTAHDVRQDWVAQQGQQPEAPAASAPAAPAPDPAAWGGPARSDSEQPAYEQPAPGYDQGPAAYQQPAYEQAAPAYEQPAPGYDQAPAAYQQPAPTPAYESPAAQPPSYDGPPAQAGAPLAPAEAAEVLPTQMTPAVAPPPAGDELAEEALTIGRGRSNSIVLDDMLVSRQHVRITVDDEGLVIEDLASRNGTFVNGRRIERTHLHEGDRIGIGASTFEVRDGWLVSI